MKYSNLKFSSRAPLAILLALLTVAVVVTSMATFASARFSRAGNLGSSAQGRQISLETQLTVGLKAYSKADRKFINRVILLVKTGKLPRKLVDSTFLWARKRAKEKSKSRGLRPMVYFKPGLTQRAKRVGIKL